MATARRQPGTETTLGDAIQGLKGAFFVGRKEERAVFLRHLLGEAGPERLLNVCGPGGVGKSCLLDEFRRLAEAGRALFLYLDSRDFPHTPEGLSNRLAALLQPAQAATPPDSPVRAGLAALHEAARRRGLVLALDTYEEVGGDLDRWLREQFLPQLPANVLVIIAGRRPLQGEWRASPAWHQLIQPVPLADFDLGLTREYLARCDINRHEEIQDVWALTRGHPLALSLAAALAREGATPEMMKNLLGAEAVRELTHRWLREIPDEVLRALLEAAAVVRAFDQDLLGHLTGRPVTAADFDRLTGLSFVRLNQERWTLHDLVRMCVAQELRRRSPARYRTLWERALAHCRRQAVNPISAEQRVMALADFFFLLGDAMMRVTFFMEPEKEALYVVPARPDDKEAIRVYMEEWRARTGDNSGGVTVDVIDPDTQTRFAYHVPDEHLRLEPTLIDWAALLDLTPESFRLLKDPAGAIRGLSVIIPVHLPTMDFLLADPVTRPYFSQLNPKEWAGYATPEDKIEARYIRLFDVRDPADQAGRGALDRDVFQQVIQCDRMLASTPYPFYREILLRFGYEEVPGAAHYAYGLDRPTPTFLLDLRGVRLLAWMESLAEGAGVVLSAPPPTNAFGFTAREQEVARMVLAGLSNPEIAGRLQVSQITVKKHLGHAFAKADVRNRTELVKRLLAPGPRG